MAIQFFNEEIHFQIDLEDKLSIWLTEIATFHNRSIDEINYIFTSDKYLLKINQEYLDHDYFTDIITFDLSENNLLTADIYISIERVKENAQENSSPYTDELYRVMAHGLLHLLGYKDHTGEDKRIMREKEDWCLSLLKT